MNSIKLRNSAAGHKFGLNRSADSPMESETRSNVPANRGVDRGGSAGVRVPGVEREGGSMKDKLKVLLVEDDVEDYRKIREALEGHEALRCEIEWVPSPVEARQALDRGGYGIVLLDYSLGDLTGIDLVCTLDLSDPALPPIIMIAGEDCRDTDLAAQHLGLADFLVKDQITPPLLERSIRYALERRHNEQRLHHLAFYDALTDLPNRGHFRDELTRRVGEAELAGRSFGLLLLDLDHFKNVNDTLGHPVGDELLQQVGIRLREAIAPGEFVARLGGDEFVVISGHERGIMGNGDLAQSIIDSLARPFALGADVINTGTSIGIAVFPNDGEDFSGLLKSADLALYRGKDEGRGTFVFYSEDFQLV